MSESKIRWQAAHIVVSQSGLPANATKLKSFYAAAVEHGGYGSGFSWTYSTRSESLRLARALVAKGLLVDKSEGHRSQFFLTDEAKSRLSEYREILTRQEAERVAAEKAATQAAFEAEQARQAAEKVNQRHAVVLVNLHDGSSRTVGEIYTGANSDVHARNQAAFWADGENAEQYQAIVVRLTDSQPNYALPA
jgi:hypothetical protein